MIFKFFAIALFFIKLHLFSLD